MKEFQILLFGGPEIKKFPWLLTHFLKCYDPFQKNPRYAPAVSYLILQDRLTRKDSRRR